MRTMLVNLSGKIDLKKIGEKAIYVLTSLFFNGSGIGETSVKSIAFRFTVRHSEEREMFQ